MTVELAGERAAARGKDGTKADQTRLAVIVFGAAAAALMTEIVAGRLVAPYVGMSLHTWTAIIAVVLAGLSLGHLIGGRLAAPAAEPVRGRRRLAAALGAAAVASLATLPLLRVLAAGLLGRGAPPLVEILALVAGLFFLPSLFAGIVAPLATKLAIDLAPGQAGRVLGRMFALGALGSIAGTLLTGFVLIAWLGSTLSVLAVAALYAGCAAMLLVDQPRALAAAAAVLLAVAAALVPLGQRWRAFASPCLAESAYSCIRVDDLSPVTGRPSAVLVIDHLAHGINDRDEPRLLYSPYLQLADELGRRRFGDRALRAYFVGGGAYTLPRAWQRAGAELVVGEIDPTVTKVAREHLWLAPAPGLRILHEDGRVALERLPAEPSFDVVFGDAYQDVTVPPHLVTREFHRSVARRLRPDGLYMVNVIDARPAPGFLPSLVRTLEADFADVGVWLDEEEREEGGRVTYLVVATNRPYPERSLTSDRFLSRRWARLTPEEIGDPTEAMLLTDDHAPVDRLMRRVTLDASLSGG